MFGYNVEYDMIESVIYNREPLIRQALIQELRQFPQDKKVLRFPGGTISRSWSYNEDYTNKWLEFCELANVTRITYPWNINNHGDSIKQLQHLNSRINVVCVEVGNEENYHERIQSLWFINNLVNSNNLLAEQYYRPKGQQYGKTYNYVKELCYRINKDIPVVAVFGTPNALAHKWWNTGIEDVTSPQGIVIHNYRKFSDNNFMNSFTNAMNTLKKYNWYFTELNLEFENGKYYDKRYSLEHKTKLTEYLNWVKNQPQTKIIQIHSLYKNNGFCRYMWLNGKLIDNYYNWFY